MANTKDKKKKPGRVKGYLNKLFKGYKTGIMKSRKKDEVGDRKEDM